ncbi:hypothetical protein NG796_16785 [Laspinema sp. A4]|uniref:hypothetical protein n=1 Tax=Laspinema sp. D2d TaxID=2953686 RepID=UPI0021BA50B4|nr:hypothetical protein [Laspinema sp. D2d]MCT7984929.1 hypothetical protein [Laspinema sp. D2d]
MNTSHLIYSKTRFDQTCVHLGKVLPSQVKSDLTRGGRGEWASDSLRHSWCLPQHRPKFPPAQATGLVAEWAIASSRSMIPLHPT